MKTRVIALALLVLLAAAPTAAWAQVAKPRRSFLSFESVQFAVDWITQEGKTAARVRCPAPQGPGNGDKCALLNDLHVVLSDPRLASSKSEARSQYVSLQARDQYGGFWILYLDPGETVALKADFPGYRYRRNPAGKPIDVRPTSNEDLETNEPKPLTKGIDLLPKLKFSGYGSIAPLYRPQ